MNDIKEIQSILWHEIGHLLIDILLIEKHPKISIKEILIRNYKCENVSWCGWVKLEPKSLLTFDEVIKDKSLTAFKFLSLYSGCLFQSLYAPNKIRVDNCFAFKKTAIGKGDHDQSSVLLSKLLEKHPELRGNMQFFDCHNSIIKNELSAVFIGVSDLKEKLNFIISNEAKNIQTDILASNNSKQYHYIYKENKRDALIKSINEVIDNCKLKELIDGLVLKMSDNLEKHISK
ncbi:hypothetical protein [Arenibacter sp. ARW7G5Y1]|uniref:hypothetical protein n=1 Tax=Arenibacter sp. ARW7G5Y1 TaxID=2135619 RepID=UPI000D7658C7|nr:hypothetical protein [Arenibacter sp. ARW7G5Y1]PXX22844.1 hypothetical protein C7972_12223 [Arenibacter sp. ARW7G5Y1]